MQSGVEQLFRTRPVVPDGDRRHRAESGDVVSEILRIVDGDEHIMREFVLRDDLLDAPWRSLGPAPFKDTLEGRMTGHRYSKITDASVGQLGAVDQKHGHS